MDKLKKVLEEFGFGQKEIEVYLILLKNDRLSALEISRKANIDRTSVYDILQKMIGKGIAFSVVENKSKRFGVITPEKIIQDWKTRFDSFESILPELNKLKSDKTDSPAIEFFSGIKGVRMALKDLINHKKNYCVLGIRREQEEIIGYLNDQGVLRLNFEKVKERGIYEKGEKIKKLNSGEYKSTKINLGKVSMVVQGDMVLFLIWTHPYFAIRVESKEFAKVQRNYFNMIWDSL